MFTEWIFPSLRPKRNAVYRSEPTTKEIKEKTFKACAKESEGDKEEEKMDMDKDDFLMKQIDEIREKAQHLQAQLAYRESHLEELKESVDKKESKVRELDGALLKKKEEAQNIVQVAGKQLQDVAGRVENKLSELINDVEETLGKNEKLNEEQTERIVEKLDEISAELRNMKDDVNEYTHAESVKCYRNVQSSLDEIKEFISTIDMKDDTKKYLRGPARWALWFSVLNFLLLVVYILFETGILGLIF